jgi:hypothetical protein
MSHLDAHLMQAFFFFFLGMSAANLFVRMRLPKDSGLRHELGHALFTTVFAAVCFGVTALFY